MPTRLCVLAGIGMAALIIVSQPACDRPAQPPPQRGAVDSMWTRELIRMGMLDQTARLGMKVGILADTAMMHSILAVDSILTSRLRLQVRSRGWPAISRVGEPAARAAFLIVQHSPVVAFQREVLPHLVAAAGAGEASRSDAAMLEDRVLTEDGKPQRYGTQFRILDGVLVPYPIAEPETLEQRRAEVGLMPMADYVKLLEQTYGGTVQYPDTTSSGGS
ncbi:MAG: hypothetical protein L0271_11135 [Gemmatimonadetes bacterium]|nr:hypothetical protein [Gemmatimonadota bacterium]